MDIEKKVKYQTFIFSFAIILAATFVAFYYLNGFLDKRIAQELSGKEQTIHRLFSKNISQTRATNSRHLKDILSTQGVTRAFKEKNRQALYANVAPAFNKMISDNAHIKVMTFRLLDGSAFLRVHKPGMFGDGLNEKRRMILDAIATEKEQHGFEIGKLELAYRVVQPVYHENELIGVVEVGIRPAYFIDMLADVLDLEYALVFRKEMQDVMLDKKAVSEKEGFAMSTTSPFFNEIFSYIVFGKRAFVEIDGKTYSVSSKLELFDHLKQQAAYIITAEDISGVLEAHDKLRQAIGVLIVFVMIFFFVVLNYYLNFYITKIQKQFYTDELTGLPNRNALLKDLESKEEAVLMLVNINAFRTINELYSVEGGNIILRHFSVFLQTSLQHEGMGIYRISSDEFILLKQSHKLSSEQYFKRVVKELLQNVRMRTFSLNTMDVKIDLDITVGVVYGHNASLEKADMALKNARKKKLHYLFYSSDIDTKRDTHKIVGIKNDVRYALEHDNIIAYFQPIVDREGKIIKYESLARMIKIADGGMDVVSPYVFLELSQEFNLYPAISKAIITQSFERLSAIDVAISINLAPSDIMDDDMQEFIFDKLRHCNKPQDIVFEITEDEHIEDYDHINRFVKKIHHLGAKIAIDDFGTGYSNYSHIFILKPDYLKIDGSLIKNIIENNESQVFVKTIVLLAKELGIKTIAEFIFCEEVYEKAKEFGIDEFQGYYFGQPSAEI